MHTKEYFDFLKNRVKPITGGKRWGEYIHSVNYKMLKGAIQDNSTILALGPHVSGLIDLFDENVTGCCVDRNLGIVLEAPKKKNFKFYSNMSDLETINDKFDYLVLSFAIGAMEDIFESLLYLRRFCHSRTRVIITYYNKTWQPIIKLTELIGLKGKEPPNNWVPIREIANFMFLADMQIIKKTMFCLAPWRIPLISHLLNKYVANLPLLNRFGVLSLVIGRVINIKDSDKTENGEPPKVSVIVPARNEEGNIPDIVKRIPQFPGETEIIFVEGGSSDDTPGAIQDAIDKNPTMQLKFLTQDGKGKKDAVKKGFLAATGDILVILDADMTVPPESLTRFVKILAEGKGEFVNGSRMVYPMRGKAMRFFNFLGNKFFSACFSYILGQRVDDTLCGTKVLYRKDYLRIIENSSFFSDFDPFGDFDLLFGATHLNLKIVDLPVRYNERTYGDTNINRWSDGLTLLKIALIGAYKLHFSWLTTDSNRVE